jgi:transcriptional regulator GlxA family with amidase domain
VRWQNDVRYVDDGTVVSSAGITAGIDTALHLVERFAGRATAERTAAALHLPPMAGPAVASPRLTPALLSTGVVNGAFSWPKTHVALQMADGIDELAAAAVLDAYPRTFAASYAASRRRRAGGLASRAPVRPDRRTGQRRRHRHQPMPVPTTFFAFDACWRHRPPLRPAPRRLSTAAHSSTPRPLPPTRRAAA